MLRAAAGMKEDFRAPCGAASPDAQLLPNPWAVQEPTILGGK